MTGKAALHCLKYLLGAEPAATQTTPAERSLLASYAGKATRLLEIGVFEGASTRIIAASMPGVAELYAVDPFFPGRFGICWSKFVAQREARKSGKKSVRFLRAKSVDAAPMIEGDFDYIFIDADHSLEAITADWEIWSRRCRVGGVMAFHDTRVAPHAPQVGRLGSFAFYNAVIARHPDFREIDAIDTLSILRRVR